MFHISKKTSLITLIIAIFTLITVILAPQPIYAAVVPSADLEQRASVRLSAPLHLMALGEMEGESELILDGLSPKARLRFDMPGGDYATDLHLKISALPQGRIDTSVPVYVQFNNGTKVPIRSRGQRFEAQISLAGGRIRSRGNMLTFTYGNGLPSDCMSVDKGQWVIDLTRSRLTADLRSKSTHYDVAHMEPRLRHPMTKPKSVTIIAKGSNAAALEALAAQGIGLRTRDIPKFKIGHQRADLKILIGTRANLGSLIKDPKIKNDARPVFGVQTFGRNPQIVMTANSQEEVLDLVQTFARLHLPRSRRNIASLAEMRVQMPFTYETHAKVNGRAKLMDLGAGYFDAGYRPKPIEAKFKVDHAQGSSGELLLGLSKSAQIDASSRVSARLNGTPLGFTKLDKTRKTVAFSIPNGALNSGVNTLTLTPTLSVASSQCTSGGLPPSIMLSQKSKLTISTPDLRAYDLGSFAATGAPFSDDNGLETDIYMTGTRNDRGAALAVLAKVAQSFGQGLTQASYINDSPNLMAQNRHALVIGPLPNAKLAALSGAPRALQDGLRGRGLYPAINPANKVATLANTNAADSFKLAARQNKSARKRVNGMAAIYAAPGDKSHAIGVISTARPAAFASLAAELTREDQWSNLSGGVARWDSKSVMMVQAADTRLSFQAPARTGRTAGDIRTAIDDFNLAAGNRVQSGIERLSAMLERQSKVAPAPMSSAPVTPTIARAPTRQITPQVTVAPKPALSSAPALRGRAQAMPVVTSPSPSRLNAKNIFDWSGFDMDYFKSNVTRKTKAKFAAAKTSISGSVSKFNMPNLSLPQSNNQSGFLGNMSLKTKAILLALIALLGFMLLALTRPASSNRNVR